MTEPTDRNDPTPEHQGVTLRHSANDSESAWTSAGWIAIPTALALALMYLMFG